MVYIYNRINLLTSINCILQAAYLVAISDPSSVAGKPGLVDANQFQRARHDIQKACDDLLNPASTQQQVKKHTKYQHSLTSKIVWCLLEYPRLPYVFEELTLCIFRFSNQLQLLPNTHQTCAMFVKQPRPKQTIPLQRNTSFKPLRTSPTTLLTWLKLLRYLDISF